MNRAEFIAQLSFQLKDIAPSDRADAITYYNSYFDEAGPENEATVIEELGNPRDVARGIKAGLRDGGEEQKQYTEHGYQDNRFQQRATPGVVNQGAQKKDYTTLILVIIIAVLTSPVWLSILAAVGGMLIGLVCGLAGILIGLIFGGLGLLIAGVYATISGIIGIGSGVSAAMLTIGGGLLCVAFGLLAVLLFVLFAAKAMPAFIHWFADICRKLTAKVKKKGGTEA